MGECPYIGRSAVELIQGFLDTFQNTTHYYFKTYRPEPGVGARLAKQAGAELRTRDLVADGVDLKEVVQQMLRGIEVDESKNWIRIPAEDINSWLPRMQNDCSKRGEALAIYSRCRNKDRHELHIPMMDFRISSKEGDTRHLNLLSSALQHIGQREGVFLDSGNSYHYYGFELLTPVQWKRFMAACLLLDPLVDVRYISHRMLAGKASLRLNETLDKKNPIVIACL
jgi:hypothetical protein